MIIVNYGGGTNSTALLVEAHRRGLRPDVIVFSDTGNEMPHTYAYLETMAAWCARVRFPVIDIVRWERKDGSFITIEESCLAAEDMPSKAYGYAGCTSKWKQQPIDKFIKNHPMVLEAWARGQTLDRWIGYDADEPVRAERAMAKNPQPLKSSTKTGKNGKPKTPKLLRKLHVIQDRLGLAHTEVLGFGAAMVRWRAELLAWDMGREECVAVIERAGLPQPGKSSCFFCPSMKKHEIDWLAEHHPDLLARALRIEDRALARNAESGRVTSIAGLGRNFSWRAYIEKQAEALAAGEIVEPECGCYDGGGD